MLLDAVVEFCNQAYQSYGNKCGHSSGKCSHPSGNCSGSCYNCLYQVHYPSAQDGKKEYDCPKMIYHYVCQYSYLYTTELLCAFEHEWSFIKGFPYFHILSLGCGGCADLMAFDMLRYRKNFVTPISYMGIDKNNLWSPVHHCAKEYCRWNNIAYQTHYSDVFEFFQNNTVNNANIVVISYLISYLYNTDQINAVDILAKNLVKSAIEKKGTPLLLVINDVNSYKRGRDYFSYFESAIRNCGLTVVKSEYKYFDNGNLYDGQKVGSPYSVNGVILNAPEEIQMKYHAGNTINATIQLLVEVS